jgi:hypothetical protein
MYFFSAFFLIPDSRVFGAVASTSRAKAKQLDLKTGSQISASTSTMRDSHFRVCWGVGGSLFRKRATQAPHSHTHATAPQNSAGAIRRACAVVLGVTTLALGAVTLALAVGRLDLPLEDGTILCSRGEDTLRMT